MPACDRVKAVKTPIAYRGIRASTRPPKATATRMARIARATIPALKARRSPRYAKPRGMNPSRARIEASRGKSAKLVWAASTRIPIVEMRRMYQASPWPKVARPICERTDSVWDGTAPATLARKEIPRKTKPRITAIATIVAWAFFHSGGLNAGVPLEIASVPVIALQPSAKARMRRSRLIDSTGTWIGVTPVTCGGCPRTVRTTPTTTRMMTLTTKT